MNGLTQTETSATEFEPNWPKDKELANTYVWSPHNIWRSQVGGMGKRRDNEAVTRTEAGSDLCLYRLSSEPHEYKGVPSSRSVAIDFGNRHLAALHFFPFRLYELHGRNRERCNARHGVTTQITHSAPSEALYPKKRRARHRKFGCRNIKHSSMMATASETREPLAWALTKGPP